MQGAPLRDLHILFFVTGAATAALLPFFALLLQERGLDPAAIGLVLAANGLAAAVAGPVWGHFADTRHGTARILALSSWASAVAAIAFLPTGSSLPLILIVAAALWACPTAPFDDALAVETLGQRDLTTYGNVRLWMSLGWALTVIGFGALYQRAGLSLVMPAYAAGAVVLGVWALRLRDAPGTPRTQAGSRLGASGDLVRAVPKLVPFIAGAFLMSTGWSAGLAFLGLRIVDQGGGPLLVGLAVSLIAFVEIPVMRSSGALGRRFGLRVLYVSGAALYVVLFVAWALIEDATLLALVASFEGIAFSLVYVGQVVLVGRLVPARFAATGQSLFGGIVRSAAPIAGSLAGGLVFGSLGAPVLFAGCAVLIAAGACVVWVVLDGVDESR